MNFFKPYRIKLAATAIVAGLGVATAAAVQSTQGYPKVIEQAVGAGMSVVKSFPAASGLTGWVLSQGGRHSVVYTTADKKTLLAGVLIGEDGANLSTTYEEQYLPQPDFSAAYQKLGKAAFVTEGTLSAAKNTIYVFVDPNCPFCNYAWRALQPYEAAGLQVRWIPVATLGPTSMPKALEVMAAADRTAAFRKMEANHGKPWTPAGKVSEASHPALAAAITKNGELMEAFGIQGTPGIVWRDKQGKVQVKAGMPRLAELPAITGLPEQQVSDPALDRFR